VIKLDGKPIEEALWGSALPVDPGDHVLEESATGRMGRIEKVTVKPGDRAVTFTMLPLTRLFGMSPEPAPAVAPAAEEPASSPRRTAGLVIGGIGIAGVGVGAVLGVLAKSTYDQSTTGCLPNDPTRCGATAAGQRSNAFSLATGSTVAFIAGAALVGGGAVLFFTAPSGKAKGGVGGRRVEVRPVVGLGGGGMSFRGEW
jgi:hypothetical protein